MTDELNLADMSWCKNEIERLRQRVKDLEYQAQKGAEIMADNIALTKELAELRKAQGEPYDEGKRDGWAACESCHGIDPVSGRGTVHQKPVGYVRAYALETLSKPGHTVIDAEPKASDDIPLYTSAPSIPEPMSREPDLHTPGIYVVLDADGAPVLETLALTGYSARAQFVREKNLLWSKAQEQGYRVVELRPV